VFAAGTGLLALIDVIAGCAIALPSRAALAGRASGLVHAIGVLIAGDQRLRTFVDVAAGAAVAGVTGLAAAQNLPPAFRAGRVLIAATVRNGA
jgi:hypothetical protein